MKLAPLPAPQHSNSHAQSAAAPAAPSSLDQSGFTFRTTTWQGDGFGFDATSGEFFTASPTALIVMQALSEKLDRQQILERLTSTFDVTLSTAERDLESFIAELVHLGLTPESN